MVQTATEDIRVQFDVIFTTKNGNTVVTTTVPKIIVEEKEPPARPK